MAESQWGITEQGYICPTEEQILNQKIKRVKELLGDYVSTSETTVLGKLLRISARSEHRIYEEIEKTYYSASPSTATGVSLDRVITFAFVRRNMATYAQHKVKIYSDNQGYEIPRGTLVRNAAGIKFYTLEPQKATEEADTEWYALCKVQCIDSGTLGNVTNIDRTVKVDANITRVEWLECVSEGSSNETDAEVRERYKQVVDGLGVNTLMALKAAVLRVSGVHACEIHENPSDKAVTISSTEPTLTLPAYSYGIVVDYGAGAGDVENEIAKAIYEKRPFAIAMACSSSDGYGKEIKVKDATGVNEQTIKFTKIKPINVYVKYSVQTDSTFPLNGEEQIKANIREYIDGLSIGETLVYTRLFTCIYTVTGVVAVDMLAVGTSDMSGVEDDAGHTQNITVMSTQVISHTSEGDIIGTIKAVT